MSDFICYALNRKKLLGISKQIYNYEEVIMRNSIRKIASLCLAMTMVFSTLAMTAFAVHNHVFSTPVSETQSITPYDDSTHCITVTAIRACTCGETYLFTTVSYLPHFPAAGSATGPQYSVNDKGEITALYVYTCKICGDTYLSE